MDISKRQEKILGHLIKLYIRTAEPISSSLLEEKCNLNISAATIRNDLQDLAKRKYIAHLHTSGGRVPTDKAYRFYVDNLINKDNLEPNPREKRIIKATIEKVRDNPQILNKSIANVLSDLSENLVITNILKEDDFNKVGLSSLFEMPEFREFDKVFRLTSFFDEFDQLFNGMVRDFFGEGLESNFQMFIGHENSVKAIRDETIIFARYPLPQRYTGSLTLIGPTRMDYEKNIGLVRYMVEQVNDIS